MKSCSWVISWGGTQALADLYERVVGALWRERRRKRQT